MRSRADPPATDLEESLTISPGDVVGGRFRVERLVGEGGMGSVFLARDTQEDIAVALKVLAPLVDGRSADADAAVREAQLLSDLRHPGIVGLVAHGVTERGRRYIAMEWIDGHDLDHHLKDQRLDLAETLRLGRRVAEALAAAHRIGVIHRDIKPGNIILPGGRPEAAKLVDFGIAQITRSTILTAGTLGFAAPEQLTPGADVDARVDVFALGWVLIACLVHGAGARLDEEDTQVTAETRDDGPEDGDESEGPPDIVALCPEAPPQLQALLHRMISRAPEERPANAGVVASEIQAIAAALEDSDAVITAREQHLVAAIALPHLKALGVDEPTVRGLLQRYGAALEPGAAACDLVRIHALVAEGDLATRVARCALELRRVLPLAPLSLVLRLVSDDLAALREEAICLFTQASTGSPRGVLVNAEAAGLLGTRFELEAEADATTLLREATATRGARMLLGRPSPWVGQRRRARPLRASYQRSRDVPVALLISG
ncbi:MAG: serine/threonine-protein kinase [Nannocystaceae bacterium]